MTNPFSLFFVDRNSVFLLRDVHWNGCRAERFHIERLADLFRLFLFFLFREDFGFHIIDDFFWRARIEERVGDKSKSDGGKRDRAEKRSPKRVENRIEERNTEYADGKSQDACRRVLRRLRCFSFENLADACETHERRDKSEKAEHGVSFLSFVWLYFTEL